MYTGKRTGSPRPVTRQSVAVVVLRYFAVWASFLWAVIRQMTVSDSSVGDDVVARSKEEYKKSVDWHRRLSDDIHYRQELRRLVDRQESMQIIWMAVQMTTERPTDTSELGLLPKGRLPNPPPRK